MQYLLYNEVERVPLTCDLWRVNPRFQTTINVPQHALYITGEPGLLPCLDIRTTLGLHRGLPRSFVRPR